MEKDQIFILKDRGVVYINGEDVKNFLQNILTNDINKVDNNFSYSSGMNNNFLSVDELRQLIKENIDPEFKPI